MIVSGKNTANEILKNKQKINKILISDTFKDEKLILELEKRKIQITVRSKNELDRIDKSNHQGIILDIPDYEYFDLKDVIKKEKGFLLILDHIEDPHNFGAIIRTCEAAGVDGIIIPKDRSVEVTSTVMRTSAGALSNFKIIEVTNLKTTIDKLKKANYWIFGTEMNFEKSYKDFDYSNMNICLIIGSEGFGMSKIIKESCDYLISIPMKGKINSLNASVAAGILIYKISENR